MLDVNVSNNRDFGFLGLLKDPLEFVNFKAI